MSKTDPDVLGKAFVQAAADSDLKALKKIISTNPEGAVINWQNNGGNTALIFSVQKAKEKDCLAIFSIVMTAPGLKLDIQNKQGMNALMYACKRGYDEIVNILLDSGESNDPVCK